MGTRQLREITSEAARDVRDFCTQRAQEPRTAGLGGRDLLVLSIDATGVNMIPSGL
ncbi:hypothetical protein OG369_41655 [Streptomyces sp. NBC_01221]|uniref:hypothetical protein n=1 Tax=Streptomyces sp. NBC_01221 TaxID=2903782 RepID=UPI002250B547|nr:hypothetical protein [Streptomyces sp. NBC_01221]MCX4792308.1 hypothetical protein [Streptomyces sp. NBC_01221]